MSVRLANFVVVGVQRSGTSALAERISLHPEIVCGWEWTESWRVFRKIHIMDAGLRGDFSHLAADERSYVESEFNTNTRWLGFRRLFGASDKWIFQPRYSLKLAADQFHRHMRWFRDHPSIRIIHIVREDDLEWLKSKYVARTARSFSGSAYPDDTKVYIPEREARRRLESKRFVDGALTVLSESNQYLKVSYEEFSQDQRAVTRSVYEFLECDDSGVDWSKASLKRQSRKPAADYIQNIEQLQDVLKRV